MTEPACSYESPYEHLHSHLQRIEERLDGVDAFLRDLAQLEIATSLQELSNMGKQSEEIGKLSDKFDNLSGVVTTIHSDFEALRAAMQADRENLSADGQAALDAANAKADALSRQLQDLDVEVGSAGNSDIPTTGGDSTGGDVTPTPAPGGDVTQPVDTGAPTDENPPAGEGPVVAPDAPVDGGEGDNGGPVPTA